MKLRNLFTLLGVLPLLTIAATANSRAVLTVTNAADAGPGSLRDTVAMSAPGDLIEFGSGMTINLLSPIVIATNNLTIEACYPTVVLNASGLFPGLELQGVTGCAVRGLRMEGFDPALAFIAGANGNKIGGPNPCDRVEVHNGGNGIVLRDGGTSNNEFYNVVSRNNIREGIALFTGATHNRFGDGTYAGAVFSYSNTFNGVLLQIVPGTAGAVEFNEFSHCLIGTDLTGHLAAGNALSGVVLDGPGVMNNLFKNCILSGNATIGASITGSASLNRFTECHIGTDIDGLFALGNTIGVDIEAGFDNRLYGNNVISGNQSHGVRIRASASYRNLVGKNALGPDVLGNALGNGGAGIVILDGAWQNRVLDNHISSNAASGVALLGNGPHHNHVESNAVGTDRTATGPMPNGHCGIFLDSVASDNYFKSNVVSGNAFYGIAIVAAGCDRNEFKANIVGLDSTRVNAIPNGSSGVLVSGSSNIFGGMNPNEGNYICANLGWGVEVLGPMPGIFASKNEFLGNTIGMFGLGNSLGGVFLDSGAVDNFVGGTIPLTGGVPGNYIWNNGGHGVLVQNASTLDPSDGNQILSNSISENVGSGIELAGAGNCMIPAPLITAADSTGVSGYTTVSGFPCLVQVFRDSSDEGAEYLGQAWVSSSYGAFTVSATLASGDRVTATQTVEYGCTTLQAETSPFATPMTATSVGVIGCLCEVALAPCGNADPTAGCANSTGVGATLNAHGTTSVSADDLTLSAERLPTSTFAMLLGCRKDDLIVFGDGLLCLRPGSRIWRFQVGNSKQWGATVYGAGLVSRSHSFYSAAGHITAGDSWYFQVYYRDTMGPCGTSRNLTNNVKIDFTS